MLSREDNELLCRVGRGTEMGDLLRQYWLPFLPAAELPERDGPPKKVRLLGEDLVAFRDTRGDVGLMGRIIASVPIYLAYGAFWMGFLALSLDRVTWYDGLAVGLGLWLVMAVFLVPIAGGYTFSLATSGGMWLSTFLEHVVYGLVGGVLVDHRLRAPHHAH